MLLFFCILQFMGHMDVLSFISKGVNLYYPMCVLLVCLATYFSLGTRCLNILGFQTFIIEDDMSAEYTSEGKDIVRRGNSCFTNSLHFCVYIYGV